MNMLLMESAIDPSGDTDVMLCVMLSLVGLCLECAAYTRLYRMTINWYRRRSGGSGDICPSDKIQGAVGMIWSGAFLLIGLFIMIPIFGAFGVVWTFFPVVFLGIYARQTFGKKHTAPKISKQGDHIPSEVSGAKRRMEQLESLKTAGLISDQEYRRKRQEILKGL